MPFSSLLPIYRRTCCSASAAGSAGRVSLLRGPRMGDGEDKSAARKKPPSHRPTKKFAKGMPNKATGRPPRLLRVDARDVDGPRVLECLADGTTGDLVEL